MSPAVKIDFDLESPELKAEGWRRLGSAVLWWMHEPSNRTVSVRPNPNGGGWVMWCQLHDESGDVVGGSGLEELTLLDAVSWARRTRASILVEAATTPAPEQRDLFAAGAP